MEFDFSLLLGSLHPQQKNLVKSIKTLHYKLNNASTAVDFNLTCIQHGLLPKYTYHRQADSNDRTNILHAELKKKRQLVSELIRKLEEEEACFLAEDIASPTKAVSYTHLDAADE